MNAKHNNRRRLAEIRKAANPNTLANFAAEVRKRADKLGESYFKVGCAHPQQRAEVLSTYPTTKWVVCSASCFKPYTVFISKLDKTIDGDSAAECLAKIDAAIAEIAFPEASTAEVAAIITHTARQIGKTATLEAIAAEAGVPVIRRGDLLDIPLASPLPSPTDDLPF